MLLRHFLLAEQDIVGYQKIFFPVHRNIGRKRHREDRTAFRIFIIRYGSFMDIYQFMGQVKPYPHTATGEIALHETFEKLVAFLLGNADSRIGYLNNQLMCSNIHLHGKVNLPTRRSIFECIGKQIISHLIQITLIDEHFIRRHGRDKPEIHLLGLGGILEAQINLVKERYDIGFFQ